ncbi:alginate export family protein [Bradyrhizobium betae]|uniref:alginate export family protein n=1 Tax=Bradyrhizobium betae TaxID=244734 RepID=UPI0013E9110E|nr:alginate export family protein [Bradyrhizobium betae]
MRIVKQSVALATALAATPLVAQAQVGTGLGRAPTLTNERYNEDWIYLADPVSRTGHWTEPFKYIALDDNRSTYLVTGMEARSRYEGYANVNWGSAPNDAYIWHRFMPYADLHMGAVRFFAQPIVSSISGVDRPTRPVDTTGTDMLQAFGELRMDVTERMSLSLSMGRKLVSLGAGRFIDTRYGVNIPQAFEGADATLTSQFRQVTALYYHPVDNGPGDFDDRSSRQKAVWGVYATQWLDAKRAIGIDAFYLGLRDNAAVYDQGTGKEIVHTFGSRVFGDKGSWHWNIEGALQGGHFAGHPRTGWGIGGEVGYRFLNVPTTPDFSFLSEVISGDDNPRDQRLGTFNPLFPRGKYFGALSPIGPRNLIRARPGVTVVPYTDVAVSLTGAAYWRQSVADGVYGVAGNVVRSGRDSTARFIGTQIELTVAWQATPELNVTASVSAFEAGTFIRETGPAQTIRMLGIMANYRF